MDHADAAARAAVLAVDWSQPWFAPWQRWGQGVQSALTVGMTQPQALNHTGAAPVQFIAQAALPPGIAYEAHIHAHGQVPTREGLHDFFNGLCWMRFPRAKRRLNAIQGTAIAAQGVGAQRGPVRDACTLFDENAALLHAPDALWAALTERRWVDLFVGLRPLWREARIVLFGHALLEKLVQPYPAITAHVWRVREVDATCDDALDAWLATDLTPDKLALKPFVPLPVLGVPGWWSANKKEDFYDNVNVFRPFQKAHR